MARLAREGLSNPEIGARLFISPRTAQYHLSHVFTKLGISSRSQLDRVLPADPDPDGPRPSASLLRPSTWPAKPWPVALCTGGGEPSPAGMTMAGTQSPDRDDQREA